MLFVLSKVEITN